MDLDGSGGLRDLGGMRLWESEVLGKTARLVKDLLKKEIDNTGLRKKDGEEKKNDIIKEENRKKFAKLFKIKLSEIPKFELIINLKDKKQIALFKEIVISKLQIPEIKSIKIDRISDADENLANFLTNCVPDKFKFLALNYNYIVTNPINIKFYFNPISYVASRVTKEVFLYLFELSADDLQLFIKAASSTEQIVFCRCSIHCSKELDFGSSIIYNTNFIGFQFCGNIDYTELTTDWKTDPSAFSNIIDSISNCGLRDSLKKIDIYFNQSLVQTEVQELFNSKDMSHISIIREGSGPSSA